MLLYTPALYTYYHFMQSVHHTLSGQQLFGCCPFMNFVCVFMGQVDLWEAGCFLTNCVKQQMGHSQ